MEGFVDVFSDAGRFSLPYWSLELVRVRRLQAMVDDWFEEARSA